MRLCTMHFCRKFLCSYLFYYGCHSGTLDCAPSAQHLQKWSKSALYPSHTQLYIPSLGSWAIVYEVDFKMMHESFIVDGSSNADLAILSITIEKGARIGISVACMSRSTAIWKPDAEFRPERWLEQDGIPGPSPFTDVFRWPEDLSRERVCSR